MRNFFAGEPIGADQNHGEAAVRQALLELERGERLRREADGGGVSLAAMGTAAAGSGTPGVMEYRRFPTPMSQWRCTSAATVSFWIPALLRMDHGSVTMGANPGRSGFACARRILNAATNDASLEDNTHLHEHVLLCWERTTPGVRSSRLRCERA